MNNKYCLLSELVDLIAVRVTAEYAFPPDAVLTWRFDDGPISMPTEEHLTAVARQDARLEVFRLIERGEIAVRSMTLMPVTPPVPFADFDRRMIRREDAELLLCRMFGAPAPPAPAQTAPAPPVAAAGASETKEQRQDRRLQACEKYGLVMPKSHLSRLPDGVGNVADSECVTRQAFSTDVKAALKRRESAKREGSTVHRA